ncbi:tyrosine-type recombinase/integrase [Caldinitratiruptor microaerophilus]|uniref:Site-specific integrase n=1 Tax=Caldinitratiruptor microaerophilus TaxID=671077 RepID=A0AA35CLW3_9FIRM|nr:site-specific integrase [Caldinitratiruptor microaerophilus]BDG61537.1 site-specific integrase [Caldinitratiruptor microaerophilus]
MKGTIRQRGRNSWQVRISRGYENGKKLLDEYTVRGTREDAEKFLRAKLHEIDKGSYTPPARQTFQQHAETWLETYARTNLRPTTAESYEVLLRKHAFPAIGSIQLEKLTPQHLQRLYADKLAEGLSPRRVQYLHLVIHGCLKAAVKWGLVGRNVADAVDAPRPERREVPILTSEDLDKLIRAAEGTDLEPVVLLAVGAGLRRGEALGLKWEDVDLDAGVVRVRRSLVPTKEGVRFQEPKTARGRRTVALPPFVVDGLKRWRKRQAEVRLQHGEKYRDQGLVCAREDGSPMPPASVTHRFERLAAKAGFEGLRLHDARHGHATVLLAQGVHPKVVQERLGHSTISVTMDIYSHVMPGLQEEAARKLDEALNRARARSRRSS